MTGFANPVLLISVPIFFVLASVVLLPFEKKVPFIKKLIAFVPLIVCAINLVIICLISGKVFSGSVVVGSIGWLHTNYLPIFAVDKVGFVVLLIVSILGCAGSLYNIFSSDLVYMAASDGWVHRTSAEKFHILFTLLILGTTWLSITGDLLGMFISFMIVELSLVMLVHVSKNDGPIKLESRDVLLIVVTGTLILLSIAILYIKTGSLNIAQVGLGLNEVSNLWKLFPYLLLFFVFSILAAIFPLNRWLPNFHFKLPFSVSTFVSGIVTTTAIYMIIRLTVTVFNYTQFAPYMFVLALLTLFMGNVFAFFEDDLRGLLAYSTIGEMGLILLTFSTGNELSIAVSLAQLINHSISKAVLFLILGVMAESSRSSKISLLQGFGRKYGMPSMIFVFAAASLIGVPPFLGFFTKFSILKSLLSLKPLLGYFSFAIVILVWVIEGVYFYKILKVLFSKSDLYFKPLNHLLLIAPIVLVALLILLSIKSMNVLNFTYDAVTQLMQRVIYFTSVLGVIK
jgi:formate hydrogenlyase subunit 3/multisubunit Na+/H+ antiporter MnhD subunit